VELMPREAFALQNPAGRIGQVRFRKKAATSAGR
jgi:hypothetical protein